MNNIWKKIKFNIGNTRFFSNNTMPKILSIVFAIIMWLYVMGEVNPQSMIELTNVEVQLLNVEELKESGLVIMGQKDFSVNVKISGRRNDIYKMRAQDLIARADIRGFDKGVNSVPVEISTSHNVSISEIFPSQIKITLDEIVQQQKPVMAQHIGIASEGFEPSEATISPTKVIVEGPESLVNKVTMVLVDVNIKDRQDDVIEKLPLKAVNSEGKKVNGVEVKNKYVEIVLPILRIKDVPISIAYEGAVKEGYEITNITLSQETVKIKGRKEIVESIKQINAKPINLEGVEKNVRKDIYLVLPKGIETPYLDKTPSTSIMVEPIKSKDFNFKSEEVNIKNVKQEYIADLSQFPQNIKVSVMAKESMLDKINKEDIELFIDANDLSEGLYYIQISHNISQKVENITIFPKQVDLIMKKQEEIQPTDKKANAEVNTEVLEE
ncbi:CdaR family protein [Marinisporobacter balticus]|uniref:YbbR domain-containing protein n=1 Tax=Marinisporobacter balticus TaxID=2018667 RepID=A0A4R2KM59_9FIRM|nr:CdaR family protein [Marinisporobacter balticus]TCO71796.1 YbbR domain-containing protein [Marinisporobacter balticus]